MGIPLTGANLSLNSSLMKQSTVPTEESTLNYTLSMQEDVDNIGSLYYVVAVIFIYGFSIVLMIASHIRKNQQDNQLRTYLKEMALLRKKDRREKILNKMNTITTNMYLNNNSGGANSSNCAMVGPTTSSLNTATNNIPQFNQAVHHCCLANISNCNEHSFNEVVSGLGIGATPSAASCLTAFHTNKTMPLTASNDYNNAFPDENCCHATQNILQMKPTTGALLAFTDGHLSNPKRSDEVSEMIPLQANLSHMKCQHQTTMPTNRCLETIINLNDTTKRHVPKNDKKPLAHIDIINEEVTT
ncbi:uncharacterized protein LOC106868424 [Octopus bimaculoides]|uniref:Uncharacterized protein n=1 Tax=Octopus bimaculoides TaxID=37653 RepID=A0A0L8HUZ0_OCTBM|nr:uncharacterized protein LOC106868424 [Octopus bimaculoides]XP_052828386.1 uncharacterized protein LOC106868424 [Octopus bimaculoides]|eukprot:XP_014769154.1 PREDICTED: uncharacterized protein LOC106868424 [Octopus bimaculoides]